METALFFKGILIGFSIAAPVGPIGILCIRRTLAFGFPSGLASGLGTATADALYGLVAAFGLTAVSGALLEHLTFFRLVGGVFLCWLGVSTLRAKPAALNVPVGGQGLGGAYVSAFFLTLTNPLTILSFAAVFAGLGIADAGGGPVAAGMMVLGVFVGSVSWWLLLSGATNRLRAGIDLRALRYVNLLAGLIILAFGLACFITL